MGAGHRPMIRVECYPGGRIFGLTGPGGRIFGLTGPYHPCLFGLTCGLM